MRASLQTALVFLQLTAPSAAWYLVSSSSTTATAAHHQHSTTALHLSANSHSDQTDPSPQSQVSPALPRQAEPFANLCISLRSFFNSPLAIMYVFPLTPPSSFLGGTHHLLLAVIPFPRHHPFSILCSSPISPQLLLANLFTHPLSPL